jgi:hypothetical protein
MLYRLLPGVLAALALSGAAHAEDFGACLWSKLSAAEQSQVMTAYGRSVGGGGAALSALDPKILAAAPACSIRTGAPLRWLQVAASAEAMQVSMAEALRPNNITRAGLDAAWTAAPENAKACIRAAATRTFHLPAPPCPDQKAPTWLIQRLQITPDAAHRAAVAAALLYFTAKGHSEYADALIQKFNRAG